ncbi:hypothetical protein IGJ01_000948 [Enterococcus sp. AZ089]|uniref:hypothetical protein n=1 Tax=Enterococcus sp. AZ089 TaxID=2774693 RepID=UPI003D2FF166
MKKILLSTLAIGAILSSVAVPSVVSAATPGEKDVKVIYSNQNTIPDPDNPGDPQWQVAIPSAVSFNEERKKVDVTVELQDMDGNQHTDSSLNVGVKLASTNGYKLTKDDAEIDYQVGYGSKVMTTGDVEVGTLTGGSDTTAKIPGLATLTGTTNKVGQFTDTLTYTVQKQ